VNGGRFWRYAEKVFSLFEPDTEMINRGKTPQPIEFGHRVLIVEDRAGFILHACVMEPGQTDEKTPVALMADLQSRFHDKIKAASFDKGFHSPANQSALAALIPLVVLPKKGKRSEAQREREAAPEFIRLRRQHSAVESAINALEVHGLDRCLDHGLDGFKRYVALAVVARNIQRLGALLRQQETERARGPYRRAA